MIDRRQRDDLKLLRALDRGATTAKAVASALNLDAATTTAILVRARDRGLVVSEPASPTIWKPSEEGQALLDAHPERTAA